MYCEMGADGVVIGMLNPDGTLDTERMAELIKVAGNKEQQDALYRDGLIQRFEFTVELSWKSLKEYLEDQGFVLAASSPRAVLKDAYAAGVIQDAERWNQILTARNITSHVYDEKTADGVAAQICNDFLPVLQALGRFYRDE